MKTRRKSTLYTIYYFAQECRGKMLLSILTAAMILCLSFYCWQAAAFSVLGIILSALALRLMGWFSHRNAPIHQQAQNDIITATLEYIR